MFNQECSNSEFNFESLTLINNDRKQPQLLCRIAHIPAESTHGPLRRVALRGLRTEQFRPAIVPCLNDHGCRDEHFFSLFQFSELSQLPEALSS